MLLNNFYTIVCTIKAATFESIRLFAILQTLRKILCYNYIFIHRNKYFKSYITILVVLALFSCNRKNKNNKVGNDKKTKNNINITKKYKNNIGREKKNIGNSGILSNNIRSGNTSNLENFGIKINTKNAELYGDSNVPEAFSKEYPKYKILFPGCCFEGVCVNPQCEACDKYVWATMGGSRKYDIIKKTEYSNDNIKYTNLGYSNIKFKSLEYAKIHLQKELKFNKSVSLDNPDFITINLGKEIRNAKCPLCMHYIEKIRACGFSKAIVNVVTKNQDGGVASRLFYAINKPGHFIYQKLAPNKVNEYRDTKLQICYIK